MYYVYILQSTFNRKKLYIGFTKRSPAKRLEEHNAGKSEWTKQYRPWRILYCEVYRSEADAREREQKLKQYGSAYAHLKKRIYKSMKE